MQRTIFDGAKMHVLTTQDVSADLENARLQRQIEPGKNARHVGTIPGPIAAAWAKECGCAVGTAGFAEHVRVKLMSGEYSKLLVHGY